MADSEDEAGWRKAKRPHGAMRPFLINGDTFIHAAAVYDILGSVAPSGHVKDAANLFKTSSHDPDFQLEAIRWGNRWVFRESSVFDTKARLLQRRSCQSLKSSIS